jgi:hypothetical protein
MIFQNFDSPKMIKITRVFSRCRKRKCRITRSGREVNEDSMLIIQDPLSETCKLIPLASQGSTLLGLVFQKPKCFSKKIDTRPGSGQFGFSTEQSAALNFFGPGGVYKDSIGPDYH